MTDDDGAPVLLPPADEESRPLLLALDTAEPKPVPDGRQADKKNYAQRLSNALAQTIADALRPEFPASPRSPTAATRRRGSGWPAEE